MLGYPGPAVFFPAPVSGTEARGNNCPVLSFLLMKRVDRSGGDLPLLLSGKGNFRGRGDDGNFCCSRPVSNGRASTDPVPRAVRSGLPGCMCRVIRPPFVRGCNPAGLWLVRTERSDSGIIRKYNQFCGQDDLSEPRKRFLFFLGIHIRGLFS